MTTFRTAAMSWQLSLRPGDAPTEGVAMTATVKFWAWRAEAKGA